MKVSVVRGMQGVVSKMQEWNLEKEVEHRQAIVIRLEAELRAADDRLIAAREKLAACRGS